MEHSHLYNEPVSELYDVNMMYDIVSIDVY